MRVVGHRMGAARRGAALLALAGAMALPGMATAQESSGAGEPALACGLEEYPAGPDEYGHTPELGALRRAFDKATETKTGGQGWRLADCLADEYLIAFEDKSGIHRYQIESIFDHVVRRLEQVGAKAIAEARLEEFISANPKLGTSRLSTKIILRARLLRELDRIDEARTVLEDLLATPEMASGKLMRTDVWDGLGQIAIAQKRGRDARNYYAQIASNAREYPTILNVEHILAYAKLLEDQGDAKAAEVEYRFLIDSQSEYQQPDQPNWQGRKAMDQYAGFLRRQKRGDGARFYELPQAIAQAVEARETERAQALGREIYAEAKRLYKPADADYRRALQLFAAVIDNDTNSYELPAKLRTCGPWPIPEPERAPEDPNMPRIVYSGPAIDRSKEKIYFSYSRRPVVEADLVGGFLTAIPELVRYANGCRAPQQAADLLASLAAIGRAQGYTPADLQSFYLAEAPIRVALDDFPGAEKAYLAAADSAFARDNLSIFDSAKLFNELLNFYLDFGRYDQAEAQILRFLETDAISSSDSQNMRIARTKLVDIYIEQGKTDKAIALLQRIMPKRPTADDPEMMQNFQNWNFYYGQYGRILNAAGLHEDAAQKMKDEIDAVIAETKAYEASGKTVYGFQARRAIDSLFEPLGDAYYALGRYAEATDAYEQAVGISAADLREIAMPETLAPYTFRLAASYAQAAGHAGQWDKVDKAAALMAQVDRLMVRPQEEAQAKLWSVSVARGIGDPAKRPQALADGANLVKALDRQWLLSQRSGIETTSQLRRLHAMPDYYGDYASLLWRDAADRKAAPPVAEAVRLLQRASLTSTDLSLGASLAKGAVLRDRPELVALTERREELGRQLSRATAGLSETVLRETYRMPGDSQPRDVNALVGQIQEIDRKLAASAPDYFAFVGGDQLDVAQLKALARPSEAIVMLVPGASGTHAVTITTDAVEWTLLDIDEREIDTAVRRLLWFAGGNIEPTLAEVNAWSAAVDGGLSGFDRDSAFGLYQKLVAPLLPRLQGKTHLVIAGSGVLSSLPFGMLVTETPQGLDDDPAALRSTRWFADRFALVQVPSLQSLSLLRRYAGDAASAGQHFVGFGDPVLAGKPVKRGGRGATREGPAGTDAVYAPRDIGSGLVVDPGKLVKMARLPGTRDEIEALATAFGTDRSEIFLGDAATEARVRGMDLRGASIIAFATHGLTSSARAGLAEPGLVLTPPSAGSAANDGYLAASEIAALRLNADWVILSACNTAAGDGSRGATGLSGLAKAFFYAGTRNLLASHWPVRDDVAARLTVLIVEIARDNPGISRAEAFQRAMATIRNERTHDGKQIDPTGFEIEQSWAHPNAWAPFTLIGQGAR